MTKIPEAMARLFNRVWVCRKCKATIRGDSVKIRAGKVKCRKCQCKNFRIKTKEKKTIK